MVGNSSAEIIERRVWRVERVDRTFMMTVDRRGSVSPDSASGGETTVKDTSPEAVPEKAAPEGSTRMYKDM